MFANMSAEAETILAGHHDIQNNEIDGIGRQPRASFGGALHPRHAESVSGKILRQRLTNRAPVSNKPQVGFIFHDFLLSRHQGTRKGQALAVITLPLANSSKGEKAQVASSV